MKFALWGLYVVMCRSNNYVMTRSHARVIRGSMHVSTIIRSHFIRGSIHVLLLEGLNIICAIIIFH